MRGSSSWACCRCGRTCRRPAPPAYGRLAITRRCPTPMSNAATPTARLAVRDGRLLARNLLARMRGQLRQAFRYHSRGMMAGIGHMKDLAEIVGEPFSGLPAWHVWRTYYLSQMPTLRRKLRVFVEWTWGMFFAVDIIRLRCKLSACIVDDAKP